MVLNVRYNSFYFCYNYYSYIYNHNIYSTGTDNKINFLIKGYGVSTLYFLYFDVDMGKKWQALVRVFLPVTFVDIAVQFSVIVDRASQREANLPHNQSKM